MKRAVDLAPFFKDYTILEARAEDLFAYELGNDQRCGRDHTRCCSTPITLSLIEAVHLTHFMNARLSSDERLQAIGRAVETAKKERSTAQNVDQGADAGEYCLSEAGATCPLLHEGACMLWEHRPLQCRTYELAQDTASDLWNTVLAPGLEKLSLETWFAYTGVMAHEDLPGFALADVVSGRYVQAVFHLMMRYGAA
jgi:Fe-S-cluster containining protein